jgi:CTP synthase
MKYQLILRDKLSERILKKLSLQGKKKDLKDWQNLVRTIRTVKKEVRIGIVGKYFGTGDFILTDSYISVIEAINHASFFWKRKPIIQWLDSEAFERNPKLVRSLKKYNGIIIPGGFGSRGVEGKIKAIEFCRRNRIPYFGLCLGLQLAVIEFARNVCKLKEASSREFDPNCRYPVIDVMPEQKVLLKEKRYGGTMRLGAYSCRLVRKDTKSWKAYNGQEYIWERHRHRYEVNNDFRELLEKKGLIVAGLNPERNLIEIMEIKKHPFFVGTQFHPELKSRPLNPHPLFRYFIWTCLKKK